MVVVVAALAILIQSGSAFVTPRVGVCRSTSTTFFASTERSSTTATDFSSFADSLEQEPTFSQEEEPWQAKLESLLDPRTPLAQRQILASELLSANDEIRESVQTALRDRKIDSLLTPTGKKLQDGTRAVARQLTTDIFPRVLSEAPPPQPEELWNIAPKIGSRILNALGNQAKKQLEQLQGDLADPSRIPERISRQTEEFAQEARNVFLETPEGLDGPAYTVVSSNAEYEVRDYEGYTVAATNMATIGEPYKLEDVATTGAAFNALAAYLFGANTEGRAMDMTTPVTTTSLGEMRFYLKKGSAVSTFPEPLLDEKVYDTGSIRLVDIPPARLAVRRFTGFVTDGEVSRQKEVLLQGLQLDGWELDVPHGVVVPHVIFQYNPPYTLPMIRRNELAVPIRTEDANEETNDGFESWSGVGDDDVSPSDY